MKLEKMRRWRVKQEKQAKEPASSHPRRQRLVKVIGFVQGQIISQGQKQDYCFDDLRPNSLLVYFFFDQTASRITCLVSFTILQCEVLEGLKKFNSKTWCRWKWHLLQAMDGQRMVWKPCFGNPGLWRPKKKKLQTTGAWNRQQQLWL